MSCFRWDRIAFVPLLILCFWFHIQFQVTFDHSFSIWADLLRDPKQNGIIRSRHNVCKESKSVFSFLCLGSSGNKFCVVTPKHHCQYSWFTAWIEMIFVQFQRRPTDPAWLLHTRFGVIKFDFKLQADSLENIPKTQLTEGMLADLYTNLASEHPDETEVFFKKQNGMFQLADNPNSVRKKFENIFQWSSHFRNDLANLVVKCAGKWSTLCWIWAICFLWFKELQIRRHRYFSVKCEHEEKVVNLFSFKLLFTNIFVIAKLSFAQSWFLLHLNFKWWFENDSETFHAFHGFIDLPICRKDLDSKKWCKSLPWNARTMRRWDMKKKKTMIKQVFVSISFVILPQIFLLQFVTTQLSTGNIHERIMHKIEDVTEAESVFLKIGASSYNVRNTFVQPVIVWDGRNVLNFNWMRCVCLINRSWRNFKIGSTKKKNTVTFWQR